MTQHFWYLRSEQYAAKVDKPELVLAYLQQGYRVITRAEFESLARIKLEPKPELPFTISADVRANIRRLAAHGIEAD